MFLVMMRICLHGMLKTKPQRYWAQRTILSRTNLVIASLEYCGGQSRGKTRCQIRDDFGLRLEAVNTGAAMEHRQTKHEDEDDQVIKQNN
jgi:hypothetical protein